MRPVVSIIVPFYNLEAYVRDCLDSIRRASAEFEWRAEVIAVDDGSTDKTGALLDAYSEFGETVNYRVVHQANGGEGRARNTGLEIATGGWIAFLDGDDCLSASALVRAREEIIANPNADIVNFRLMPFADGERPDFCSAIDHRNAMVYDIRSEIPDRVFMDVGVVPTFFRAPTLGRLRFSDLPLGADRLYVAECLTVARTAVLSSDCVYAYRQRKESMAHAQWNERKICSMIEYAAKTMRILGDSGKRMGTHGARYLGDVLLSVAPKHIRRMTDDATAVRRRWLIALEQMNVCRLSMWQRLRRYCLCKGILSA